MWIKSVSIENFASIIGREEYSFRQGVNFLAGNNNVGKTTIFRAIDGLFNKFGSAESCIPRVGDGEFDGHTSVEAVIEGIPKGALDLYGLKFLENFNLNQSDDSDISIKIRRSTEPLTVKVESKTQKIDEKKLAVFNPEEDRFENPSGIDQNIGQIFDVLGIWADIDPDDVGNFGSTKAMGKLMVECFDQLEATEEWASLKSSFNDIFSGEMASSKAAIEMELLKNVGPGFPGVTSVLIDFSLPKIKELLKNGTISVNDGVQTNITAKGSGLQRALAVAIMRTYADMKNDQENRLLAVLMDEPETWLHPSAQIAMAQNLEEIAGSHGQLFVSTHSPYMLRGYNADRDGLYVLTKSDHGRGQRRVTDLGIMGSRPSLNEISYFAFNDFSEAFHTELFGELQLRFKEHRTKSGFQKMHGSFGGSLVEFDKFLKSCTNVSRSKRLRDDAGNEGMEVEESLPVLIRNRIHHRENKYNDPCSAQEIGSSIREMLDILKSDILSPCEE